MRSWKSRTASDPACMNRSDTALTKPVVILIAFVYSFFSFGSHKYMPA